MGFDCILFLIIACLFTFLLVARGNLIKFSVYCLRKRELFGNEYVLET